MNELKVIAGAPVSFACYVIIAAGTTLVAGLSPLDLETVGQKECWLVVVATIIAAFTSAKSWLSDTSHKIKNGLASEQK